MNKAGTNLSPQPYLSPLAAWAYSVGTAIGWGSLVVTSQNYLSQAGPLGTVLGLLVGLVLMLMIASHYHFFAKRYPEAGGLYAYTKNVFGYDCAFLAAWILALVYMSVYWANATSLAVFARYFLNDLFRFGYLYTIFGYEVYLGEALLTIVAISLFALFCSRSKRLASNIMVVLVFLFTAAIIICFVAAMVGRPAAGMSLSPAFLPDKNALQQVLRIAFISPWAFIGFESISNSSQGFRFKPSKTFRILTSSLIATTALYILITLLSITAYPEGCSSWIDYITHLDNYSGIDGLPAFYAANYYLGNTGVVILMLALLALVFTSLIGNMQAISRLFYAISLDGILPWRFSKLNDRQIPSRAILLVVLFSIPVPFLGRTAVGWIVDVTTIGATIIYGFISAAVFKVARSEKDKLNTIISSVCLAILLAFLVLLFADHTIATETFFLLTVWAVAGFFYFHHVITKDHARRFGKAIIVWLSLLVFIVLLTLAWTDRMKGSVEKTVISDIQAHYSETYDRAEDAAQDELFLEAQRNRLQTANTASALVIAALFGLSLAAMLINNASLHKWEKKARRERDEARDAAYRDALTGVKSKLAYAEEEQAFEQMLARGEALTFGLIVCDVNGLKHINDTLGHKAGDAYICEACELLCENFKHSPVFRIGGDEFVVILQGRDYDLRAELMNNFNIQVEHNIGTGKVVASLGLSDYDPETDLSFRDVFSRADEQMYARKTQLKQMGAITRE